MATQHDIDDALIPRSFRLLDRKIDEDRCDHYGRVFIEKDLRWAESPMEQPLEEKDRKGLLADDAPLQAEAKETIDRARQALETFRRFANKAKRNSFDAHFWELAAEETVFRVELFEAMRRVYLAKKEGRAPDAQLKRLVQRTVEEGDALYNRSRMLWAKLLPPLTLDEEILTRWGEPKAYLAAAL